MKIHKWEKGMIGGLIVLGIGLYGFELWAYRRANDINRINYELKNEVSANYPDDFPKTIIIGDSRAIQLDPLQIEKETGIKMYNMSAGGSGFAYMYYVIQRLNEQIDIDKVYLMFPPWTEGRYKEKNNIFNLFLRYFATEEEAKDFGSIVPGAYEFWKDTRFMGKKYFALNIWNRFFKDPKAVLFPKLDNDKVTKSQEYHRGFRIKNTNYKTKKTDQGEVYDFYSVKAKVGGGFNNPNLVMNQLHITEYYLDALLALLDEKNIDYEFFHGTTILNRSKKFKNLSMHKFLDMMAKIPKERRNDDVFILHRNNFYDWFHLNGAGARKSNTYFSKVIVNDEQPSEDMVIHNLEIANAE